MAEIFSPKYSTPKRVLFRFKKHLGVRGTLTKSPSVQAVHELNLVCFLISDLSLSGSEFLVDFCLDALFLHGNAENKFSKYC